MKRILWIDEEKDTMIKYDIFSLKEKLKGNAKITVVDTLGEAKKKIELEEWDIVILDIMFPDLSNEEEKITGITKEETYRGIIAGAIFYEKYIKPKGIKTVVYTYLNKGVPEYKIAREKTEEIKWIEKPRMEELVEWIKEELKDETL